ncbi:MAG: autotransporter outer membrane beta-barrel domain-containing protein [Betaproteobacteria bacterium]
MTHNLGTTAPPATMGGYAMQSFALAPQIAIVNFSNVTTIPGSPVPGSLTLATAENKRTVGAGWATWSHGYTGPVYVDSATANTLTLPAGVHAFYFYAEPSAFATKTITATTNSGATSGPINVNGSSGATGFGFSATAGETITTITIVTNDSSGFAIGEFGIDIPASPSGAARPDPSQDPEVIGLLKAQADFAERFAQTQIGNFQGHLESLHARSKSRAGTTVDRGNGTVQTLAANNQPPASLDRTHALSSAARCQRAAACQSNNSANCATPAATTCADPLVTIVPVDNGLTSFLLGAFQSAQSGSGWAGLRINLNSNAGNPLGSGLNVWSAGTITIGRQNDRDMSFTTSGVSVGSDLRISDSLVLGLGAGFGHERQDVGNNGTKNQGDGAALAIYGSYQPQDGFFVDGVLGYSRLDFDAQRYVTSTGGYADLKRDGSQWFASLSGAYELWQGDFLLSPYGRLDLISSRFKRSTESGAGVYDLVYFGHNIPSTKLSIGLRGETLFDTDEIKIKPYLRAEYQYEFAKRGTAKMAYLDQEFSSIYQLDLGSTDRSTIVLGFGANFVFKDGWLMGLGYRFSKGSSSTQFSTVSAQINKAF